MKEGVEDVHHVLNGGWGQDSAHELSYTMSQRRVLITHLASAAQKGMKRSTVISSFSRTGCAMTVNGEDDDKIRPQGADADYVNKFHVEFALALSRHTEKKEAAIRAALEGREPAADVNLDSRLNYKKFLLWVGKRYRIVHVRAVLSASKGEDHETLECQYWGCEGNTEMLNKEQKIFPEWINEKNEIICRKEMPAGSRPRIGLHSAEELFTYYGIVREVKLQNDCITDDLLLHQLNPKVFLNPRSRNALPAAVDGSIVTNGRGADKLADMIDQLKKKKEEFDRDKSTDRALVQHNNNVWVFPQPHVAVVQAPAVLVPHVHVLPLVPIPPRMEPIVPIPVAAAAAHPVQVPPLLLPRPAILIPPPHVNIPQIEQIIPLSQFNIAEWNDQNQQLEGSDDVIDGLILPNVSVALANEAVNNIKISRGGRQIRPLSKFANNYVFDFEPK